FGHGAHIELHYRVFHELSLEASVEGVFARAISVPFVGKERPIPCWHDQLWIVALHAATHALIESPTWIFDLALLIHQGADVSRAFAEAESRNGALAFCAAFELAHRVLPECVPDLGRNRRRGRLRARALESAIGATPYARPLSHARSLWLRALLTET